MAPPTDVATTASVCFGLPAARVHVPEGTAFISKWPLRTSACTGGSPSSDVRTRLMSSGTGPPPAITSVPATASMGAPALGSRSTSEVAFTVIRARRVAHFYFVGSRERAPARRMFPAQGSSTLKFCTFTVLPKTFWCRVIRGPATSPSDHHGHREPHRGHSVEVDVGLFAGSPIEGERGGRIFVDGGVVVGDGIRHVERGRFLRSVKGAGPVLGEPRLAFDAM